MHLYNLIQYVIYVIECETLFCIILDFDQYSSIRNYRNYLTSNNIDSFKIDNLKIHFVLDISLIRWSEST